jgi:hypothetical protein
VILSKMIMWYCPHERENTQKTYQKLGTVAHTYNPSYSEGTYQED